MIPERVRFPHAFPLFLWADKINLLVSVNELAVGAIDRLISRFIRSMTNQQEELSILADVCICAGCLLYELEGCKSSSLIGKSVVNKRGRLPKRNASLSKFFSMGRRNVILVIFTEK